MVLLLQIFLLASVVEVVEVVDTSVVEAEVLMQAQYIIASIIPTMQRVVGDRVAVQK